MPHPHEESPPHVSRDGAAGAGNSLPLDQWRGLALVFVLISHGFFFTGRVGGIGRLGVNLFFFISGVLVFRSLEHSRQTTSRARALDFWKRRTRRLYPALVAYVLALLPFVFLLRDNPEAVDRDPMNYVRSIPQALLYGVNYMKAGFPMGLGHLWSLSCEMQFYLLAPIIFLLGGKGAMRRHLVWGSILAAALAIGLGVPVFSTLEGTKYHFEIAAWPMMLGFCAEYRRDLFQRVPASWLRWLNRLTLLSLWVVIALMVLGHATKLLVVAVGSCALVPCFIAYAGRQPIGGAPGRLLEWLGERTYSIYLWQQPLTICGYLPGVLHPAGAVLSGFVGGWSFRFFEQPFLSRSRKPFTARRFLPRAVALSAVLVLLLGMAGVLTVRWRYERTLAAKVWPAPRDLDPATIPAPPEPRTILLLGDSRAAEWRTLELQGWRTINEGSGGLTSAELEQRCRALVAKNRPALVILQVGINDLKFLGVRPDLRPRLVDECLHHILSIARACREAGAQVMVLRIWPLGPVGWGRRVVWSGEVEPALAETNLRLARSLVREEGVSFVDLFEEWPAPLSVHQRARLYRDTLHLKAEVYPTLTEILSRKVQSMPGGQGTP